MEAYAPTVYIDLELVCTSLLHVDQMHDLAFVNLVAAAAKERVVLYIDIYRSCHFHILIKETLVVILLVVLCSNSCCHII